MGLICVDWDVGCVDPYALRPARRYCQPYTVSRWLAETLPATVYRFKFVPQPVWTALLDPAIIGLVIRPRAIGVNEPLYGTAVTEDVESNHVGQ